MRVCVYGGTTILTSIIFITKVKPLSLRTFFNRVAHEVGFHPVKEPESWYTIKQADICCYKVRNI